MLLMPPAKDVCPICAVKHPQDQPHDGKSLYYQYRFYGVRGRWPTWADALAHCDERTRRDCELMLRASGAWSEPADGQPIADPPGESFNQPIGVLSAPGFPGE